MTCQLWKFQFILELKWFSWKAYHKNLSKEKNNSCLPSKKSVKGTYSSYNACFYHVKKYHHIIYVRILELPSKKCISLAWFNCNEMIFYSNYHCFVFLSHDLFSSFTFWITSLLLWITEWNWAGGNLGLQFSKLCCPDIYLRHQNNVTWMWKDVMKIKADQKSMCLGILTLQLKAHILLLIN